MRWRRDFGHKWYEFDVGWAYIRLLSLVGLAQVKYARGVDGYDRDRGDDPTARVVAAANGPANAAVPAGAQQAA